MPPPRSLLFTLLRPRKPALLPTLQFVRPFFWPSSGSSPDKSLRVLDNARTSSEFHTALSLSTTSSRPLVALWTISAAPHCNDARAAVLKELELQKKSGRGVVFVEVEADSAVGGDEEMGRLAGEWVVWRYPTLMMIWRGDLKRRTDDVGVMTNEEGLKGWVRGVLDEWEEARKVGA